jgi:hypothetical protein
MEEADVHWLCRTLIELDENPAPTLMKSLGGHNDGVMKSLGGHNDKVMRLDEVGYSIYNTTNDHFQKTPGAPCVQEWNQRLVLSFDHGQIKLIDSLGALEPTVHAPPQVLAMYYLWYHMIHVIRWSDMKRVCIDYDRKYWIKEDIERVFAIPQDPNPTVLLTSFESKQTAQFMVIPITEVTFDMFMWFASHYRKYAVIASTIPCGNSVYQFLVLSEPGVFQVDKRHFYPMIRYNNYVKQLCLRIHERSDYMRYMGWTSFPHRTLLQELMNCIPQATYCPSSPIYRPSSPTYCPSSPVYRPSSPVYQPSSPSYRPTPPSWAPE